MPQIEVTFDIDANGILHVSAKDKATGKEQKMEVIAPNKMKREDIEKMMKEAEEHAEEDKVNLENAQTRNEAESLVYTTDKTLKEYKEKIPKDVYDKVESAKKDVDESLKGENYGQIKSSTDKLHIVLRTSPFALEYMYVHSRLVILRRGEYLRLLYRYRSVLVYYLGH